MNIIKFVEEFPDEAGCREHWRVIREKEGVVCKRCKCEKNWWLKHVSLAFR